MGDCDFTIHCKEWQTSLCYIHGPVCPLTCLRGEATVPVYFTPTAHSRRSLPAISHPQHVPREASPSLPQSWAAVAWGGQEIFSGLPRGACLASLSPTLFIAPSSPNAKEPGVWCNHTVFWSTQSLMKNETWVPRCPSHCVQTWCWRRLKTNLGV